MSPAKPKLADLSPADRASLEACVVEFDQSWTEARLAQHAAGIPPGVPWRAAAIAEMVSIDLERQWQQDRPVRLEQYLARYPELGTAQTVPAELIAAEYEARRSAGKPVSAAEIARRFPLQAADVKRMLQHTHRTAARRRAEAKLDVTASFPISTPSKLQSRYEARLPEHFGRYRILQRLGAGGMGTVYLAHDTQLDRRVALKVPYFAEEYNADVIARFRREAQAAAMLRHPNICPVLDVAEYDGVHFLTMGYIVGKPLSQFVLTARERPLAQRSVAITVRKLALALAEAHARGVVHRDLKPSNIMIDNRREPIVMDFGLARRMEQSDVRLTNTGSLLGTPAYMAPEQVRGDVAAMGPSCDIYSLGGVLYELLTGRQPFTGPVATVLYQAVHEKPASPAVHRADLDPRLAAICLKALAKEPEHRFRDMAALAGALEAYLQNRPLDWEPEQVTVTRRGTTRAKPTSKRRTGRRGLIAASGLVGAVMLAGIFYFATDHGTIRISVHDPAATIIVDGKTIAVDQLSEPLEFRAGEHELVVKRGDLIAVARKFTVRRGENPALMALAGSPASLEKAPAVGERDDRTPDDGQPGLASTVTKSSADQIRRATTALDRLRAGIQSGLPAEPSDPKVASVRDELLTIARQHAGGPEAMEAVKLMSRITWPIDGLKREKIDPVQLRLAGGGDPAAAPAELVAVLGDGRLVAWQAATVLAFSPRGERIATGGGGNTAITVWECASGCVARIIVVPAVVQRLVWCPDGVTLVANLEGDNNLGLWDAATGKARQPLLGRVGAIRAIGYSNDGRWLWAAGASGVQLWQADTFAEQEVISAPAKTGWLALKDRDMLAGFTVENKSITLWRLPGLDELAQVPFPKAVQAAMSQNGKWLAVANSDGTTNMATTADGVQRWAAKNDAGAKTTAMSFSTGGDLLAVGTDRGEVTVFRAATGDKIGYRRKRAVSSITALAFAPDDKTLAISEWDNTIDLLDTANWNSRHAVGNQRCRITTAALSRDGRLFARGGAEAGIELWDLGTAAVQQVINGPGPWPRSVAFNADGALLAVQNAAYDMNVYEIPSGRPRLSHEFKRAVAYMGRSPAVEFAPQGNLLAVAQSDFSISLMDLDAEIEVRALRAHKDLIWGLAFSPTGDVLASGSADRSIRLWNPANGQMLEPILGHLDQVRAVAFSPDGHMVASGGDNDRKIKLWDVETGRVLRTVPGPYRSLRSLRFSPDGEVLVASGDGPLNFWNVRTGQPARPPLSLGPPLGGVLFASFTPDGRHLVTGNNNGVIYVLRLRTVAETAGSRATTQASLP